MNIRKLDLRLLECLDALVTERNVTRAASRVHMSQPAMSSALKRLRDVFGDPLLARTQRGMVPTPRSIELAQSARSVLQEVEAMSSGARPFEPATAERTFRIAMTDYTEFVLLPSLIRRLQVEAPHINVAIRPHDGRTQADELADGNIDLAIASFRHVSGHLRARELFRERFVCLARKDNPKIGKRLTLANFTDLSHAFISPRGGGFYGATDRALAAIDRARRIAVSVPHFLVAPFVVAGSNLIMVLPERVARHYAATLPLRILEPPVRIEGFAVSQVWHERSDHDAAVTWLRAVMIDLCTFRSQPVTALPGAPTTRRLTSLQASGMRARRLVRSAAR
ncbi:MAG TPA: LysR family transcriptional regulator [Casimicrobiaceae bacterium]|nr:LysR family transcriptional regulator [Casimicrobiaceae bacterium]